VATRSFADHHVYSESELAALRAQARRDGLVPVTTAKDLARLGESGAGVTALRVTLMFDDERALRQLVARALTKARSKV
jgi:tetraacyldisaccharide 4'-kinase